MGRGRSDLTIGGKYNIRTKKFRSEEENCVLEELSRRK